MKKLVAVMSLIMMLSAGVTAFAADVTYDSENEKVTSDIAEGKSTVLITKGSSDAEVTAGSIVYMDQATDTFSAATEFLIKAAPTDGEYTVRFGGNSTATATFYIGLAEAVGDIEMEKAGNIEELTDGFGIGYTITAPGTYNSLLIKTGDKIVGCALNTTITTEGDVTYGVQINAETEEELNAIDSVYLSERVFGEDSLEVQQ